MSESEARYDTWLELLSQLEVTFGHLETELALNESEFHQRFVELCEEVHETDPQRSLARFQRQHDRIIAFVGALDDSLGLDEPKSLGSIFWRIAYATVQFAFREDRKAEIFGENLPKLNEALPVFGAQLPLFPDVLEVREPLQTVFREYINCYAMMLLQFDSQPAYLGSEFHERVLDLKPLFAKSKKQWEESVKIAQENENTRLNASSPSLATGSLGFQYPYAPRRVSFEWLGFLGQGTYGSVSKVRQPDTGNVYAQKVIRVTDPKLRPFIEKQVRNEVEIMTRLSHHHIASIVLPTYEEEMFTIMMLPVADCHLLQFLQRQCINESFQKQELARLTSWFGCLTSALAFAHASKVKHEDIKPTNILIKDNRPYLSDFGSAQDFSGTEQSRNSDVLAFGTPVYWAPEDPPRGRAADVFSLGCVFSEMLTVKQCRTLEDYLKFRFLPHKDNPYAFRENLDKVYYWMQELSSPGDDITELLIETTLNMLKRDESERPEAKEVQRTLRQEGEAVFCTICF